MFRWVPSELNYWKSFFLTVTVARGEHFFMFLYSAYDLHRNCLSPSLMDLDIGEADLASHTHVPAMTCHSCHNRMISLFARDMLRLAHLQALFNFVKRLIAQRSCLTWVR